MKRIALLSVWFLFPAVLIQAQINDKNSKEAKKAYNQAIQYISQQNYDPAITYLDACLDLDSTFNPALSARAKCKVESGNISGAVKDFNLLSRKDPSLGEPDFYLAYLNFNNKPAEEVLRLLNVAVEKGYNEPQVWYYRGLRKLIDGDNTGAVSDFTEAIKLKSDYVLAFHDRGTAKRELGDMQGALYDYRMATNYRHNFPMAFNNMGSVRIILGDYNGAIEDYTVAINLDPQFYIAMNNRGSAEYFLGDLNAALQDFDAAISVNETYIPAMNNKAGVITKQAGYTEAIDIFNKILTRDQDFARAYLNRGLVRELTGDLEGACADWNKALELGITEAQNYVTECK